MTTLNKKTMQKCRKLLRIQALFVFLSFVTALLNICFFTDKPPIILLIAWFFFIGVAMILCTPIAKSAVCPNCGKSILASYVDSYWNTIPLFKILWGHNPLCRECEFAKNVSGKDSNTSGS